MIRSYLLVNVVSWDYLPELERWLYKDHAPDTMSQLEPILHRYVTYRAAVRRRACGSVSAFPDTRN